MNSVLDQFDESRSDKYLGVSLTGIHAPCLPYFPFGAKVPFEQKLYGVDDSDCDTNLE